MQITVDTAKDSVQEIKKIANLLLSLVSDDNTSSNDSNSINYNEIVKQDSNLDETNLDTKTKIDTTNTSTFNDSFSDLSDQPKIVILDENDNPITNSKKIPSGQDGIAQKLLEESRAMSKEFFSTDNSKEETDKKVSTKKDKDTKGSKFQSGVILY